MEVAPEIAELQLQAAAIILITITRVLEEPDPPGARTCYCTVDHGEPEGIEENMLHSWIPNDPYQSPFGDQVQAWLEDPNNVYTVEPWVPPPPLPYYLQVETLWFRLTETEAEEFDAAVSVAPPLKTRKQFQVATQLLSTSDLFVWVRNILVGLFGATRADELMVQ